MPQTRVPIPPRSRYNDLYSKLGLSPNASPEAIEDAYGVLESVYHPDGGYSDDVMAHAFLEISNAWAILSNPRKRKLYDRGYIDESGRSTEAGRARDLRLRKVGISAAVCVATFVGYLTHNQWAPRPKVALDGVVTSGAAEHKSQQADAAKPVSPPQKGASDHAPDGDIIAQRPPSPPEPSQNTNAKPEEVAADAPLGSESEPAGANPQGYLPPGRLVHRNKPAEFASPRTSSRPRTPYAEARAKSAVPFDPERHGRRQAQPGERESKPAPTFGNQSAMAEAGHSEIWESDIWFPHSPPRSEVARPAGAALKTAQCLACLTNDRANCSKACP